MRARDTERATPFNSDTIGRSPFDFAPTARPTAHRGRRGRRDDKGWGGAFMRNWLCTRPYFAANPKIEPTPFTS
jgi:hypothetical protein